MKSVFKKFTLPNGLRLITYQMKATGALTILILVGTGSKYETKRISGISHFLEHMAFKGTKKRPDTLDIAKELDRVGGAYNAFTGKEYTGFWVKVAKPHFDLACDVLSDILFNSIFKKTEIERERKVIFEEINMLKDNPQIYVGELWEKLLYGDQPAGWLITGEPETVSKISREDLLSYLNQHFTGQNSVLALTGDFEEKEGLSKIKKYFSSFKNKKAPRKKKVKEIQRKPQFLIHFKETDQTHFSFGVRAFDIFNEKRYPLIVLATILGGMMSSRLFIEVRHKRALAYYIRTLPQFYTDSGYLVTEAGVNNQRVKEAIAVILKEYQRLKKEKISPIELKRAKENIKGKIYLELETSDDWATFLATQEILKKKISLPDEECDKIDKVKEKDILAVANEIFRPEKLNLALIGPFKKGEELKKLLTI